MRNPPDRDPSFNPADENSAARPSRPSRPNQGGRRARTIRDMFSLDQPLRRLTNIPARKRRPNAPPREQQRTPTPPDLYAAEDYGGPPVWRIPGAHAGLRRERHWLRRSIPPTRPTHAAPTVILAIVAIRATQWVAPLIPLRARPIARTRMTHAPDLRPDMRWNSADLIDQGSPFNGGPPITPAPPTTPRYGPGPGQAPGPNYGWDDQTARTYQPPEDDQFQRQQTDYRATSVRAAFWASRTPSYEPDQPPSLSDRDDTAERALFRVIRHAPRACLTCAFAGFDVLRAATSL